MPTFGMLFFALLLIAAGWWLKEMLQRWREDLEELRHPQASWTSRLVIVGLWLFTLLVVAPFIVGFAFRVLLTLVGWVKFLYQYK